MAKVSYLVEQQQPIIVYRPYRPTLDPVCIRDLASISGPFSISRKWSDAWLVFQAQFLFQIYSRSIWLIIAAVN